MEFFLTVRPPCNDENIWWVMPCQSSFLPISKDRGGWWWGWGGLVNEGSSSVLRGSTADRWVSLGPIADIWISLGPTADRWVSLGPIADRWVSLP